MTRLCGLKCRLSTGQRGDYFNLEKQSFGSYFDRALNL